MPTAANFHLLLTAADASAALPAAVVGSRHGLRSMALGLGTSAERGAHEPIGGGRGWACISRLNILEVE